MKASNNSVRMRTMAIFSIAFAIAILALGFSSSMTIVTAQKGISLLEQNKKRYDEIFETQAQLNRQMKQIFTTLESLRIKDRMPWEYVSAQRHLESQRKELEQKIASWDAKSPERIMYGTLFRQIKTVQATLEELNKNKIDNQSVMEELEECRGKYQEVTTNQARQR